MALSPNSEREALSSTAFKTNKYSWIALSKITKLAQTTLMDEALELLKAKYEEKGYTLTENDISLAMKK